MKINEIFLKSYGIYKNEKIDLGESQLIVIMGKNRAGKSTFMEALRTIPMSNMVKKSPYKDPHVEITVETHKGLYEVAKTGQSETKIKVLKGESTSLNDLYNGLDGRGYSNLYMVSLDELYRLPYYFIEEGNKKKEEEGKKLATLLMGAGVKEWLYLNKVALQLDKQQKDLGGALGNSKKIKESLASYNEALLDLEEAKGQVEDYDKAVAEQEAIMEENKTIKEALDKVAKKHSLLTAIQKTQSDYTAYLRIQEQKETCLRSIGNPMEMTKEGKEHLLLYQQKIKALSEGGGESVEIPAGKEAFLEHALQEKDDLLREMAQLEAHLSHLQSEEEALMLKIENQRGEGLLGEEDITPKDITSIERLGEELAQIQSAIKEEDNHLKLLELNALTKKGQKAPSYPILLAIGGFVLGVVLSFLSVILGVSLIVLTMALLIVMEQKNKREVPEDLIKGQQAKIDAMAREEATLQQSIDSWAKKLYLPEGTSVTKIIRTLEALLAIKEQKNKLRFNRQKWQQERDLLIQKKAHYIKESEGIFNFYDDEEDDIKTFFMIFFRKAQQQLQDLFILREKNHHKEQLSNLFSVDFSLSDDVFLEKMEGIEQYTLLLQQEKTAVQGILPFFQSALFINDGRSEEKNSVTMEDLSTYYEAYNSPLATEEALTEYKKEKESLTERKNNQEEEIMRLTLLTKGLRSAKNVAKAKEKLDRVKEEAKQEFSHFMALQLAKKAAEKGYQDMVKGNEGKLMQESRRIFERLTGGDYKGFSPKATLSDNDYAFTLKNNETIDSTDHLSRSTRELFYLAVRFGQIAERPPLPILLDDPLTNMDVFHEWRVLEEVVKIAQRQQVFLLSCHNETLEKLSAITEDFRLFYVEEGKITKSNKASVLKALSH